MDRSTAEAPAGAGARPRPRVGPVGWALLFGALSTAGLAVLAFSLLVLHALGYGMVTVIAPDAELAGPSSGRYGLALAVGVVVQVATAAASMWLAARTPIGAWPPAAQGLGVSLLSAALASCALLLTVGIDPVGFFLGR